MDVGTGVWTGAAIIELPDLSRMKVLTQVSESIIRSPGDVAIIKPCSGDNTIRVELEAGVDVDLERLQRHFYTTSSCGICGKVWTDFGLAFFQFTS